MYMFKTVMFRQMIMSIFRVGKAKHVGEDGTVLVDKHLLVGEPRN